jgi:hypothetical protein
VVCKLLCSFENLVGEAKVSGLLPVVASCSGVVLKRGKKAFGARRRQKIILIRSVAAKGRHAAARVASVDADRLHIVLPRHDEGRRTVADQSHAVAAFVMNGV